MYLKKISLINFKNFSETELLFSEKINCFTGLNGSGKTNLLDAIYYLSFCKSYFNYIDAQNIKHNEDFFVIQGNYFRAEKDEKIYCGLKKGKKKIFRRNNTDYKKLSEHIGLIPLVMISPYDRDLINEGSDVRRKYIDGVISQFDKFYLDDLLKYNKALYQRNSLLKKFSETNYFDQDSLDIWSDQLIKLGNKLFEKRKNFLEEFIPIFQHYFEFISENKEKVNIKYNSQLIDNDFEKILETNQQKDRILRYTTVGTHKDDLDLLINDFPVKKFGSQGQQKSFVIAIKLAQFAFTKDKKGFKPVLLFDDIFDKLDDSRVKQLIQLVSENNFGQVFITDTQKQRIEKIFKTVNIDHNIFEIKDNEMTKILND